MGLTSSRVSSRLEDLAQKVVVNVDGAKDGAKKRSATAARARCRRRGLLIIRMLYNLAAVCPVLPVWSVE